MKNVIYGILFLGLVGLGFVGCKKESDYNNNQLKTQSQVKSDILKIFETYKDNSYMKNLNRDIRHTSNPFDTVGYMHNEVLRFILLTDFDENKICDKIGDVNHQFGTNLQYSCDQLFFICDKGIEDSFDKNKRFKLNLLDNLKDKNKIGLNEYQIISSAYLLANDLNFNDKINFIKNVEDYTLQSLILKDEEKVRILKSFSIYRYSSDYWEKENPQPQALGPVSAYADACAEYWALNSPDSPAQDGADVYAFAGFVSAVVHIATGY